MDTSVNSNKDEEPEAYPVRLVDNNKHDFFMKSHMPVRVKFENVGHVLLDELAIPHLLGWAMYPHETSSFPVFNSSGSVYHMPDTHTRRANPLVSRSHIPSTSVYKKA